MSLKEHDKRTFIIDSANAYTARQISKREFLRRMGLAGIGFSSFGLAMLGGYRRGRRGFARGSPGHGGGLAEEQAEWAEAGGSGQRAVRARSRCEGARAS